jgi:FkbH-like protein
MKVVVEPLTRGNLPRAVQLLNKTNQMNLSTRRMSEKETWDWAQNPGRRFWTISIVDRFGDLGLTGILSVEEDASVLHVVDFLLSCRVMGRRVEEIMLHCAVTYSCRRGLELLRAKYIPTLKNKPCLELLQKCGFSEVEPNNFTWKMIREFPLPEGIQAEFREDFRGGDS